MNDKIKSPRDIWDKIDIVSKIISGIVLVLIAIVLKIGTDKISSSLQTGQLVQSLIADLSSPDTTKIRQEIALVALDQTLWDQNKELVLEICERIVKNTDQFDQATGTLAFQIIERRDSARANLVKEKIKNDTLSKPVTQELSSTDSSKVIQETATTVVENSKLLNRVKRNRVYLQFGNENEREKIRGLQKKLIEAGFTVPGIEMVKGNYQLDIRYFHSEDKVLIGNIGQTIESFLKTEGIDLKDKIPVKNLSKTKFKDQVPVGNIEVWINLEKLKH